jgi:uncharacterized protein YxjI
MLDKNSFVVKEQGKMFSSRKEYDILDGETGQPLGCARQKVSGLMSVLGLLVGKDSIPLTIEVRTKANDSLAFAVRRRGFFLQKIEAVDAEGQLLGSYTKKRFSLSGGFHVYDKNGKHFADIKGKMFKAEYQFLRPDGRTPVGSVSRKWGGLAKELFSSDSTYGVQLDPEASNDRTAKTLILGATLAIDALFAKAKSKGGSSDDESDEGGEE